MSANFFMEFFLPLSSIPAVLVTLAGIWVLLTQRVGDSPRRWTLFLLVAAICLALPLTLFADDQVLSSHILYILLLLIPAQIGVLAMLLLNTRDLVAGWRERRGLVSALILTLLLFLVLITLVEPNLAIILIVPAAVTAGGWALSRRIGRDGLAWTGALLVMVLILDAAGVVTNPLVYAAPWYRIAYNIAGPLMVALALIIAALLIDRRLNARREGKHWRASRDFTLALALLLALALTTYRSGLMVNASGHAAEDHMAFIPAALGVIVGLLLAFALREKHLKAGLAFMILVPILFSAAYTAAWQVDPLAVTTARAARIVAAIEQYRQENGAYPESLAELAPVYLPILLGPLNGRGQPWCYQAGADFYRLGIAYYQRYYTMSNLDPFSEIRIFSAAGEPPQGRWMCDDALEMIQATGGVN